MIGVLLFLILFILMCVFLGPVGFVLGLGLGLVIAFAKFTGGLLAFWSEAGKRKSEKECPHCCEQIPKDATVCKHCGRDTRGELNQPKKDLVPGSSMDQAWIEEFVYKFNKTVTNISNNPGQPVDDYGVLISFLETIKEKSLDTPLIKGLENKSAFEQVLLKAQNLLDQLSKNPEVQTHLGQQEEARVKKDRRHAEKEQRLMADYGITYNGSQYVYKEYRYDKLSYAVAYARKQGPVMPPPKR